MAEDKAFIVKADGRELNARTFDKGIIDQLRPLYRHYRQHQVLPIVDRVVVDLRSVGYADPYGGLGAVLLCEVLHEQFDRKVDLLLPSLQDKGWGFSSWMDTLGFLKAVEDIASIIGYAHLKGLSGNGSNYIPVMPIRSRAELFQAIDQIDRKVRDVLVQRLDYSIVEASRIETMLIELCQNIFYHSAVHEADIHGYIAMQAYTREENANPAVNFAVMDLGIGIPQCLRNSPLKDKYNLDDDREAIKLACEPNITSAVDSRGGLGLYRTKQIVEEAHGILGIRSGDAKAVFSPKKNFYAGGLDAWSSINYFWGTQVGIWLPRRIDTESTHESILVEAIPV